MVDRKRVTSVRFHVVDLLGDVKAIQTPPRVVGNRNSQLLRSQIWLFERLNRAYRAVEHQSSERSLTLKRYRVSDFSGRLH